MKRFASCVISPWLCGMEEYYEYSTKLILNLEFRVD